MTMMQHFYNYLINTYSEIIWETTFLCENRPKVTPIERQSIYNLFSLGVAGKSRIEPKFLRHFFFEREKINKSRISRHLNETSYKTNIKHDNTKHDKP